MTCEIQKGDIKSVENFLRGYRINGKLLKADRYEQEFFKRSNDPCEYEGIGEVPLSRARMYEIRHFINSLPNSDEKLLLYYHYIKGTPVERCGVILGISRSTAFRLKRRGLLMAAEAYLKKSSLQKS